MTASVDMSPDGRVLTVHVPLAIRKRGGRKRVMAPDGTALLPVRRAFVDSTLVKAIARAHRWQRMLESGEFASIAELAAAERINRVLSRARAEADAPRAGDRGGGAGRAARSGADHARKADVAVPNNLGPSVVLRDTVRFVPKAASPGATSRRCCRLRQHP